MGWVLLAVATAAVAGAVIVLRGGGRDARQAGAVVHPRRSRAEQGEPPYRQLTHYRASGALPRWDP